MSIHLTPDRRLVPTDLACRRLAVLSLHAPVNDGSKRPAVAIGVAIDRSTSMSGEKLITAKRAVIRTLEHLRDGDTIAITAFGDTAEVFLPATTVDRSVGSRIHESLVGLDVAGSTNLSDGWFLACREISSKARQDTVARCLLLTDGQTNRGITSREELLVHARELRKRFIATSAFGIGTDFDKELLSSIVDEGGGSFAYIETADQIQKALEVEMDAAQRITARSVRVQLKADPGITIHVHGGFRSREENGAKILELPDLCDDQTFDLGMSLDLPAVAAGKALQLIAEVEWLLGDGTKTRHGEILEWRSVPSSQAEDEKVDQGVTDRVAAMAADEAYLAALKANAAGDYDAAQQIMLNTVNMVKDLPSKSNDTLQRVAEMSESSEMMGKPIDPKTAHRQWNRSISRTRQTNVGKKFDPGQPS